MVPIENLRVTLIQTELVWQSPEENRQMLAEKMQSLAGQADLIILPEMFTTCFMMSPERHSEPMEGETLLWMQAQAVALNAAVCGSVAIQEGTQYINRMLLVSPTGDVQSYDKRHLFRMGNEHEHYRAGSERVIFEYAGWRILPTICYDLRFPVSMRNQNDYDLAICVANWPAPRRNPWRILLQARAIENQCYMLGVNRVGEDGIGLHYSGDSLAINFKGELMLDKPQGQSFVETVVLNLSEVQQFREVFPAWQDADSFTMM
ncbi:amidohydrolase [Neptunomonas antarctica]|uniref:Omega-amidase YafV n=1 Tax=Neptunomonas antarctica TaxID=619304 RepID=A0A1N7KY43_9GAMM|nr:amidohydrolase [Neptunomonas antarctica]SIS66471.1 Predicted amidohydrolase [Neptunomonas antarctica]